MKGLKKENLYSSLIDRKSGDYLTPVSWPLDITPVCLAWEPGVVRAGVERG